MDHRNSIGHHGGSTSHLPGPNRTTIARSDRKEPDRAIDLIDELELLLRRKGHMSVLLVTVTALALCFLVVGILMATGILLVTFFLFVCFNDNPAEVAESLNLLRTM